MANYITNIPGSTIDQYLQEGHQAKTKVEILDSREAAHHVASLTDISFSPSPTGVNMTLTKGGGSASKPLPMAGVNAGLMSAADKTLLGIIRKNYINAGATYNATTGYYSLNGLTDITEEQMSVIYADTYRKQCGKDLSYMYYGSNARTNFPARNRSSYENGLTCLDLCYCRKMEVFKWGQEYNSGQLDSFYGTISAATEMFYGCIALHTIIGVLNLSPITSKPTSMFGHCDALENVQILGLKTSLDLQSPVISYDSLRFLVDHAANTSAITVTVDSHVWNWLTGGSSPPEGHTSEEWQAINSDAVAKNISFAY